MKYTYTITDKIVEEYSFIHNTTVIRGKNNTGKTSILKRIYHALFGNIFQMPDNSRLTIEYKYKKDTYRIYRHSKYIFNTLNIKYPYDKILLFKINRISLLWELVPALNNIDVQKLINAQFDKYRYCFLFKENDNLFTYEALCDIFGLVHEKVIGAENIKVFKTLNKELGRANEKYLSLLNTNISIKRRNDMLEKYKEEKVTELYSRQEELYNIKLTIEKKIKKLLDNINNVKRALLEYTDCNYMQYSYSKELNDADVLMYRGMIIQCNKAIDTLENHKRLLLSDKDNDYITDRLFELTGKITEYRERINTYKSTIETIQNAYIDTSNSEKLYDSENMLKIEQSKASHILINIEGVERNIRYFNTLTPSEIHDTSQIEQTIEILKKKCAELRIFDKATHRDYNIVKIREGIRYLGLTTLNKLSSQQYLEAYYILSVHIRKSIDMIVPIFIDSEYIVTDATNISSLLQYNHTVIVTNKKLPDCAGVEYINI